MHARIRGLPFRPASSVSCTVTPIRVLLLLLGLLGPMAPGARAQDSSAQTAPEGLRWGRMTVRSELEFGGRQLVLSGNRDLYRSHITLDEGLRLLGFSFTSQYPENTGPLFDTLVYRMASWGGDPHTTASLRVEKRGLYRFDFAYSRIVYYSFVPTFANPLLESGELLGQHSWDAARRRSEYRLTLFPDADVRLFFGYERDAQFGQAFTTFPIGLDEFLLLNPPRTTADDYRAGVDFRLRRWRITVEQGFRAFKNDTHTSHPEGTIHLGNSRNPANPTSANPQQILLQMLSHDVGVRGRIPTTRLALQGPAHRTVMVAGRFVYSDAHSEIARQERLTGVLFDLSALRYVTAQTSQSAAQASRPHTLADASVNYRPHRRLTVTTTTRFQQFTIAGDVRTRTEQQLGADLRGALPPPPTRTVTERGSARMSVDAFFHRVEGTMELTPHLVLRGGYRFAHRRVVLQRPEESERDTSGAPPGEVNTHSVLGGVSLRLSSTVRLFSELERGSSDTVFTRVTPSRFTRLRARAHYRPAPALTLTLQLHVADSRTPNPLVDTTFRNRGLTLTTLWSPGDRLALSLGYTRADITSRILILHPRLRTLETSRYVADDNVVEGDLLLAPLRNLQLALGYSLINAQGTLPLNFHQPRGMIAYTFPKHVTWSVGWRWYGYNEKGVALQDYRAHTLTGSLKIAF